MERPLEPSVGALRLGHDHESTRASIESVHDSRPLRGAGGRERVATRGEGTEHRRARPAHRRVRGDADGLIDDDEVVVIVDDAQIGDLARLDDGRASRLPRDLEPRAGRQPVGLGRDAAVDEGTPDLDDLDGLRAREAEQCGEGYVDALPRSTFGNGKGARLGHRRAPLLVLMVVERCSGLLLARAFELLQLGLDVRAQLGAVLALEDP